MIHVLAEQSTLDGTSDNPGYLRGFGIMPAESVRRVAKTAKTQADEVPSGRSRIRGTAIGSQEGVCAVAGSDCRWPGCDKPAVIPISITPCRGRVGRRMRRITSATAEPTI